MEYALKITQMDCLPQAEGQAEVVVCVHWAYTATNGAKSAAFGGNTTLTYSPGEPFTPFDQLTEEQVAGWVLGAWTPEQKSSIEDALNEQVGVVSPPLPWAASASSPEDPSPNAA